MIGLKAKILTYCGVLLLLPSCGWQCATPSIAEEDVENVLQIAYLSDGNFDWKNVGEVIVIETGEHLQVQRNQIRPLPQLITKHWDEKFFFIA